MAYTITNTAGASVITVNPTETSGSDLPIEIVGANYTGYGQIIGNDLYRMVEHFAKDTPPANPITGMLWYDTANGVPKYYNGTDFVPIGSSLNSSGSLLNMDATANGIDLTTLGSTALFTNPGLGKVYYPTGILLTPNGTPSATGPAMVNIQVKSAEDIMENIQVSFTSASQFSFHSVQGTSERVDGSGVVYLEVVGAATGGTLSVDAKMFGFTV